VDSSSQDLTRSTSNDTVMKYSDDNKSDSDEQVLQKRYTKERQNVYSRELFNPPSQSNVAVSKKKVRPAVAAPIPRSRSRSYSVKVEQAREPDDDENHQESREYATSYRPAEIKPVGQQEYATSYVPVEKKSAGQPREQEYAVSAGQNSQNVGAKTPAESNQPNVVVNLYANGDIEATSIRPELESAVREVLGSEMAQSVLRPIIAGGARRNDGGVDYATSTTSLAPKQESINSKQQQSLPSVSPHHQTSPLAGSPWPLPAATTPRTSVKQQQGSRIMEDKLIKKISASRISAQNSQKVLDEIIGPSMTPPAKFPRTAQKNSKPLGGSQLRDKLSHISADIGQAWEARERLKEENLLLKKRIAALSSRLDHANTSTFKPASAWTAV
jgi:hypothetical protein